MERAQYQMTLLLLLLLLLLLSNVCIFIDYDFHHKIGSWQSTSFSNDLLTCFQSQSQLTLEEKKVKINANANYFKFFKF